MAAPKVTGVGMELVPCERGKGPCASFFSNPRLCLAVRDRVAFGTGRAQTVGANNLMPHLFLSNANGKRFSANLVSASNSQRPNEIQMRQLDQINRILPPEILSEMSARRLVIPAHEIALVLSRLKKAADLDIS